MRRDLHEFIIEFLRLIQIAQLHTQNRQMINDHPADRRSVVRHIKEFPRLFQTACLLAHLTRLDQRVDVVHLAPVCALHNIQSLICTPFFYQLFDLIVFCLKLVLIQRSYLEKVSWYALISSYKYTVSVYHRAHDMSKIFV